MFVSKWRVERVCQEVLVVCFEFHGPRVTFFGAQSEAYWN